MKAKLIGVVILLTGFMYGCELFNSDDLGSNKSGTVTISLTDAPFLSDSVAEANVTIDWIKLKRVGDETVDADSDTLFVMLDLEDTDINLLELDNGVSEVLGVLDSVPVGEYKEIRMHVVSANIVIVDDDGSKTVHNMKIPSGSSSGLKIKIKPALVIEEGQVSYELLLDFDANRSFVAHGNLNGNGNGKEKEISYIFKPVIRAVYKNQTGSISGVVLDTTNSESIVGASDAHLYLTTGSDPDIDTIASAKTEINGSYKIIGVPAGFYDLYCEKEEYTSDTIIS